MCAPIGVTSTWTHAACPDAPTKTECWNMPATKLSARLACAPPSSSAIRHGAPKLRMSGIRVVGTCWRTTGSDAADSTYPS